ncbi:hypothetical protein Q4F19_07060 [Sphingomonas sp. BIUV-7]|uniref:Uncharacterized protein n=1 Tax=Sphingomonas natans TaxID=3063330 RepID=A0ABT8Y8Y7_9SPHN|nr:hypothetical protein [Sphingomonas sp. BIUV-7]MDO6414135.1 hypothetical protein [Sphingomonas sp. BIUV-7]
MIVAQTIRKDHAEARASAPDVAQIVLHAIGERLTPGNSTRSFCAERAGGHRNCARADVSTDIVKVDLNSLVGTLDVAILLAQPWWLCAAASSSFDRPLGPIPYAALPKARLTAGVIV